MAIVSFSTKFAKAIGNFLPINCGIPDSVLSGISPRYIATISAYTQEDQITPYLKINAYLQENFILSAGSKWEGISQMFGGVTDIADSASQLITGLASNGNSPRSLISAASTHRKWKGSEPITIKMKLKFEAITDEYSEVMLPAMRLKQLSLPREAGAGGFFLVPPGPSPFSLDNNVILGDAIELNIGDFLIFDRSTCGGVVIDNVSVVYENRMGKRGPIGAFVDLEITTYQMLSQEAMAKVYKSQGTPRDSASSPAIGQ